MRSVSAPKTIVLHKKISEMTKSAAVATIESLPDEFSLEDLIERFIVLEKIEKGLEQVKSGQTLSSDEAKKRLEKWLK